MGINKVSKISSVSTSTNRKKDVIRKDIHKINDEIDSFKEVLKEKEKELFLLENPSKFKEGDIVMCEVPAGRVRKEMPCVLELEYINDYWDYYVRPLKDGIATNRHFMVNINNCKEVED